MKKEVSDFYIDYSKLTIEIIFFILYAMNFGSLIRNLGIWIQGSGAAGYVS
jgi:hypothetical protein